MPQSKPIFYDPDRKRWRRLRFILDCSVILVTLLIVLFVFSVVRGSSAPGVALPDLKRPYHKLADNQKRKPPRRANTHRKTVVPASQVVLNSDEGIRGAFYVQWDAASFASLKEYYPQIDLLFPEWMHALTADGRLQAATELNTLYDVIDENGKARGYRRQGHVVPEGGEGADRSLSPGQQLRPTTNKWNPDTAKFLGDPARTSAIHPRSADLSGQRSLQGFDARHRSLSRRVPATITVNSYRNSMGRSTPRV